MNPLPSEPIPFHHEMAQVPNPPAYFTVISPCEIGGETAIAHSNHIYQKFQDVGGDFAQKVEDIGVRYIRIMPEEDDPTSAIGRLGNRPSSHKPKKKPRAKCRNSERLGSGWKMEMFERKPQPFLRFEQMIERE